jgi:hypothetical protein
MPPPTITFIMILVRVSRLNVDGMALFPFVLVRRSNPGPVLLNHERIHLRQQAELGVVPFYVWYLLEYGLRRGQGYGHYDAYRAISFEREAYANERNPAYLNQRKWLAFRRYRHRSGPTR